MNRGHRIFTAAVFAGTVAWACGGLLASAHAAPVMVIATLTAAPGKEAALKDILLPLAESTRHEAGCLGYTVLQNNAKPAQYFTYEQWASQAAIDAHLKGPGLAAAMPKFQSVLGEAPTLTSLTPIP